MPDPKDTQFDSERAREAGIKSGLARRPIDHEVDAKKAYNYAVQLIDVLAGQVLNPIPCKLCKRPPIDSRTLASLTGQLITLLEMVQARAWGKPATENRASRSASLSDFKRARREVENATDTPADLPEPPPEDTPDLTPSLLSTSEE